MTDILIILVLIFFNGFFSLAEVALISARKNRIEAMAKEGSRSAASALKLMNDPDCFLSTAQVGITIVAILTGLFSGETFAEKFGEQLLSLGMDENYAQLCGANHNSRGCNLYVVRAGRIVPKEIGN